MIISRKFPALLASVAAISAATAGVAAADTLTGANWAGYVAHGARFRGVIGSWTQPRVKCRRGHATDAGMWVGLGGYSPANALEQTGTEAGCQRSGHQTASAWYELVPAPPHAIKMTVRPGDDMFAAVAVIDQHATVTLTDLTRHETYKRTMYAPRRDIDSAEWIVESPSACHQGFCLPVPLANFGTVRFTHTAAYSNTGQIGAIQDPALWEETGQRIGPDHTPFNAAHASALSAANNGFTVTYQRTGKL